MIMMMPLFNVRFSSHFYCYYCYLFVVVMMSTSTIRRLVSHTTSTTLSSSSFAVVAFTPQPLLSFRRNTNNNNQHRNYHYDSILKINNHIPIAVVGDSCIDQPLHVLSFSSQVDTISNDVDRSSSSTTSQSIIDNDSSIDLSQYHNIILFDGVCNFCNTWVDILLRIDLNEKFQFTPLQSNIGKQLLKSIGKQSDDISSVLLIQNKNKLYNNNNNNNNNNNQQQSSSSSSSASLFQHYEKSSCVLHVVEELGPIGIVLSKSLETLIPNTIRDTIYDTVAENRYNFMGKRTECRCSDPTYSHRFL